jgi:opacity protein-like surface antigen
MKKLLLALVCFCCLAPTEAAARSVNGFYIAPKVTVSLLNTETTGITGYDFDADGVPVGGGLAVGFDFYPLYDTPVRVELDWNMHSQIEDDDHIRVGSASNVYFKNNIGIQTIFVNAYYDFHVHPRFVPYLGAGLGFSFIDNENTLTSGRVRTTLAESTTTNFAWNVSAGIAIPFTENFALDFSYRYAQFGEGETETGVFNGNTIRGKTENIDAHQGIVAVRFTF